MVDGFCCLHVQVSNRYLTTLKESHPDYPYVKEYLEKVCVLCVLYVQHAWVSVDRWMSACMVYVCVAYTYVHMAVWL